MSEFVRVSVSNLSGRALDYCHLEANGKSARITNSGIRLALGGSVFGLFNPSVDSTIATAAIRDHHVRFDAEAPGYDFAARIGEVVMGGESFDIAACRAIVASVLGETVSVPKELMP